MTLEKMKKWLRPEKSTCVKRFLIKREIITEILAIGHEFS
jgi:hypothetical protein